MIKQRGNIGLFALLFLVAVIVLLVLRDCTPGKVVAPVSTVPEHKTVNGAGDTVTSKVAPAVAYSYIEKKVADSLAKVYGTKVARLQEYIISLETTIADIPSVPGTIVVDYGPPDTVKLPGTCPPPVRNMKQVFKSPYYDITAQIGDSSYLKLKSFDTLTVVWKTVKEGRLFNRRTLLQIDISKANPDNNVHGLQLYRKQAPAQKRIGVGLQLGYGWQKGLTPAPYIGVGVSYNLIRL